MRPNRSRGAFALVRSGRTQDAIASQFGVSRVAVQGWMAGRTKPSMAMRIQLRDALRIALDAWETPVTQGPPPDPSEDVVDIAAAVKACNALARAATATANALRRLSPHLEGQLAEADESELLDELTKGKT